LYGTRTIPLKIEGWSSIIWPSEMARGNVDIDSQRKATVFCGVPEIF